MFGSIVAATIRRHKVGRLDDDFDLRLSHLEQEWHLAYEASRLAGADFLALSASPRVKFEEVQKARRRLDQAEDWKAQIMVKIERLENVMKHRFEANE
jgi:pyruvate kinase